MSKIVYMLDTNICIYIIKKSPFKVLQKLQTLDIGDVCISSITLCELEYGINKSAMKEKNKFALTKFIAPIEVASFGDLAACVYGGIRAGLERAGTPIGSLDMLIAAHAKSLRCTLVTNNEKEFTRINGLSVENWV